MSRAKLDLGRKERATHLTNNQAASRRDAVGRGVLTSQSDLDPALSFDVTGSGDRTPVLLHGLMFDRSVFDELAAHLSGRFRVLAVDLPGFGRSDPPVESSAPAFADVIAALIRRVGGGPATVLGWSMGAAVALHLALEHPHIVDRLILTGATPMPAAASRLASRDPDCA